MRTEQITKTLLEKEFFNSKELKEIFSPYASSELDRFMQVSKMPDFKFIAGYVTKVNPALNAGQDFKLYKMYQIVKEGITLLKEVSACSIISSAPFQRVKIYDGKIEFTDEFYRKDKEARKILAKTGMVFA